MRHFLPSCLSWSPRLRRPAIALVLLWWQSVELHAAPPEREAVAPSQMSPELGREVEAYRVCARLHLPSDFSRVRDSASAVALALQKCQKQRFVVAGQFALDNPGTFRTRAFVDDLSVKVMEELSAWLEDVHANRVSPHPSVPRKR